MKLVTAILQPSVLDRVREALAGFGVGGLTVTHADALAQDRHIEVYRAQVLVADAAPRIRLEVAVSDADVDDVVRVIASAARSRRGDPGWIWVAAVEELVRIRTGERGTAAL
jgi:nitrogen regulatory protein P-II 1